MEKSAQNHYQNCKPKITGRNQTQIEKEKEDEWEWEEEVENEDAEDEDENKVIECLRYFGEFGKVVGSIGNNKKGEKNDYLNPIDDRIDKIIWVFCKNIFIKYKK